MTGVSEKLRGHVNLRSARELMLIATLSCLAIYLIIYAISRRLAPPVSSSEDPLVKVGTVLTLPTISTLSGKVLHLEDQPKVSLYVLFSTECPACARSATYWRVLDHEPRREGIPMYLIATEDEQELVERFARAYDFDDLTVWYDAFGECDRNLSIRYVPQYLLIDGRGKVLGAWAGTPLPGSDISAKARETLEYVKFLLRKESEPKRL